MDRPAEVCQNICSYWPVHILSVTLRLYPQHLWTTGRMTVDVRCQAQSRRLRFFPACRKFSKFLLAVLAVVQKSLA